MRSLVVGASGFVGSHLVRALLARGDQVRAMVRSETRGQALRAQGAEIRVGDLAKPETLQRVADGIEVVYHLGSAMAGPWELFEVVDIDGTSHLIDQCVKSGVRRLVYAGTLSGYPVADLPEPVRVDETVPLDSSGLLGNYARAKQQAEELIKQAGQRGSLEVVIVRPGLVCGAGTSPYPPHVCKPVPGGALILFGDGSVPLPLTYIDNAIDALVLGGSTAGIAGRTFNIVDDDVVTQAEYLRLLAEAGDRPVRVIRLPRLAYYMLGLASEMVARLRKKEAVTNRYRVRTRLRHVRWDNAEAKRLLGWSPRVPLREGLKRAFRSSATESRNRG